MKKSPFTGDSWFKQGGRLARFEARQPLFQQFTQGKR